MSLASTAEALGVHLSADQLLAFDRYRDLLLDATAEFNLTAVRDAEGIESRHFLESIALGQSLAGLGLLPSGQPVRAIDIGTGAGFPGLPVKIAWPAVRMSLLESNLKRCAFLRAVVETLRLADVAVLEGRAETWAREPAHRESYDLVLARAVAPLNVLIEYALPFVRTGGVLAASKGSAAVREIEEASPALAALGGEIAVTQPFEPPGGMPQTLVIVRKTASTPDRYPRREGVARKRPLGR